MLCILLGPRKRIQAASYCEHLSGSEVLIAPFMMPCLGVPLHISGRKRGACSDFGRHWDQRNQLFSGYRMARCEPLGNLHHMQALMCGRKLESISFMSKAETEFAQLR